MNNDSFSDNNAQFVLSYEVLRLLQWLERYEVDKLRKLIAKAVASGLHNEIQRVDNIANPAMEDEVHHNIIDFFGLLDELLADAINNHVEKKARETNLFPTIDQIDATICDGATVRSSVEKATKTVELNANTNPKEQFFIELLKRWKPVDKNSMH